MSAQKEQENEEKRNLPTKRGDSLFRDHFKEQTGFSTFGSPLKGKDALFDTLMFSMTQYTREELRRLRVDQKEEGRIIVRDVSSEKPLMEVRYTHPVKNVTIVEVESQKDVHPDVRAGSEHRALTFIAQHTGAHTMVRLIPLEEVKKEGNPYSFVLADGVPVVIEKEGKENVIGVLSTEPVVSEKVIREVLHQHSISLPPRVTVGNADIEKFRLIHEVEKCVTVRYRREKKETHTISPLQEVGREKVHAHAPVCDMYPKVEQTIKHVLTHQMSASDHDVVHVFEFMKSNEVVAELHLMDDLVYGRIVGDDDNLELLIDKYARLLRQERHTLIIEIPQKRLKKIERTAAALEDYRVVVPQQEQQTSHTPDTPVVYLVKEFSDVPIKRVLQKFFEKKKKEKLTAFKIISLIMFLEYLRKLSEEYRKRRERGDTWRGANDPVITAGGEE